MVSLYSNTGCCVFCDSAYIQSKPKPEEEELRLAIQVNTCSLLLHLSLRHPDNLFATVPIGSQYLLPGMDVRFPAL